MRENAEPKEKNGTPIEWRWKLLDDEERRLIWKKFYKHFEFNPSVHSEDWPSFREPEHSITYDISAAFSASAAEEEQVESNLRDCFGCALQCSLPINGALLALDWHHDCFRVYVDANNSDSGYCVWPISVIPDGDYHCFISEDYTQGLLGHPWEKTICVFGDCLIKSLEKAQPKIFRRIVRVGGRRVKGRN